MSDEPTTEDWEHAAHTERKLATFGLMRERNLIEVLRFYADQGNYVPAGIAPTIWKDNGQRARAALASYDAHKPGTEGTSA